MKKHGIGSRLLALLLALALVLPMVPMRASATLGENVNVSTGLSGNINTEDTISLPIKILDYENDGMLFEFAQGYKYISNGIGESLTAGDFGATWYEDYTTKTTYTGTTLHKFNNIWGYASLSQQTETYANYTRATWSRNNTTTAQNNWASGRVGVVLGQFSTDDSFPYTTDQVRYMVVVFRSNLVDCKFNVGLNRKNGSGGGAGGAAGPGNYTGDITVRSEGSSNWTYAVLDLKTGELGKAWYDGAKVDSAFVGLPIDYYNEWIDFAHVAFFSDWDNADAFGKYAVTDGSDRGNNNAFSLLLPSYRQDGYVNGTTPVNIHNASIDTVAATVKRISTTAGQTKNFADVSGLGYKLLGTYGGSVSNIANIGLLESGLSAKGYPVYKQEVVTYLANLLQSTLTITERTGTGWKNYRYIKGATSSVYGGVDLASALRNKIYGGLGSYQATLNKNLVGTWNEVSGRITTYYDAAYFLLNSIFVPGSYNTPQDDYDYLVLSAGVDSTTGDKVYVFDGGFGTSSNPDRAEMAIDYNTTINTIQNTSAAGKPYYCYSHNATTNTCATTTVYPFLPITDRNTSDGMTRNPYYQDEGVIEGINGQVGRNTLFKRNYNFAMVSEGEFVYHADDDLFFEFEGDDDVYLFINNELVMDIGSAHSLDNTRFELNDYVNAAYAGTLGSTTRNNALKLVEGKTYSFKFYYMERHSTGSNIRISTNIRVTDPTMVTGKTAWQNGGKLDFGAIVNHAEVVEYGFSITNNTPVNTNVGNVNLYNLSFTDNDIGVKLNPTDGLKVTGSRVCDVNGGTLEVTDLTATVGSTKYTFSSNNDLKNFLKNLKASGLPVGATVTIQGIGYKLSDAQIAAGVFDNTVLTTATDSTGSIVLQGQATMRVFVPSDPMYYQWAGHALNVTEGKFVQDILAAASQSANVLAGKIPNLTTSNVSKLELVNQVGTPTTNQFVTIDSSNKITINYTIPGPKVFYVKVTSTAGNNIPIISVLVNVTDVKDSVYVLDYGLKVDLTSENNNGINELIKNDAVTVLARNTNWSILGIGSGGSYTPNEITFSKASGGRINSGSGSYQLAGQTLTYTPSDFMDTEDKIQLAVNVYERGITPSNITGTLNINKEVEMYKNITVLPATVVYYEDCFPAITYIGDKEQTNTFAELGSQGVDQDENYGSDDYYDDDVAASAGSLTTIPITTAGAVAQFTFKGTGFELISRTNAYDSATIDLIVKDSTGKEILRIPVITEFDNGNNDGTEEIYQVPVVRVDDLAHGTYTVIIEGVPAYDWDNIDLSRVDMSDPNWMDNLPTLDTYLYVDGLRIFQPMDATNEHYSSDENGAQFLELRDLILNGQAAVAELSDNSVKVSSGTSTWTENLNGVDSEGETYVGNEVDSIDDYLIKGPNNEVYMDGWLTDSALAFQVKETGSGSHSLQIGIHGVDVGLFNGADATGMDAPIWYVAKNKAWKALTTVRSGTEQYYTIDYTDCPVENGAYQIILKVDEAGSGKTAMASYTSLKVIGLDITAINGTGEKSTLKFEEGVLIDVDTGTAVDAASYPAFKLLSRMLSTDVMAAPEQPELPEPIEPANPFADVQEGSFYFDAMLWAVENGITNGTSATTFSPDKLVSRAETVTFLWRAAGEPEPATVKNPFVDVKESDFFYKAVLWAVENGITNGMDATHFGPLSICNRAQVVTFLWRAAGEPVPGTTENPFRDVAEGDFYCDAVLWAIENSITNGIDAVSFGPTASCNRAQIVTFLYRAQ